MHILIASHDCQEHGKLLLALRLVSLVMVVVLMTVHSRSVRVFRWEQSVSGGVLVTYCIVALGLALSVGTGKFVGTALQVYLCGTGAVFLAINAVAIWHHWRRAGDLTRVVAELLESLGVPLERHIIIKVSLGIATAIALIVDLIIVACFVHRT